MWEKRGGVIGDNILIVAVSTITEGVSEVKEGYLNILVQDIKGSI
ncbi:hypothetical protein HLVA_00400 [Haliovirga abyssi]|uniref:Uncharacterized protein n=1 Tax=Haliovirga abyssi TaxID=2996794 RepID=A0AAU9DU81_9FUSO|nr:hypothetical protein HLVA_00400 [Haliovirga abyssi]